MKLLLDTCTFLWVCWASPELSDAAREAVVDPTNNIYLSPVSAWEIGIKYRLGRLPLPDDPLRLVPFERKRHGIETIPIDEEAALQVARLPDLHRDPFDRMLVAQALSGGLAIVTPDRAIAAYPVKTVW